MASSKRPELWYNELCRFLLDVGFVNSKSNTSLFIFSRGTLTAYLMVYMDDLILTSSND